MEHLNKIVIDCTGAAGKQELHIRIAQALQFPDWYGHNLDALMDCLTDLPVTFVVLQGWDTLDAWADGFWETFRDAQTENPDLQVTFLTKKE